MMMADMIKMTNDFAADVFRLGVPMVKANQMAGQHVAFEYELVFYQGTNGELEKQ